MPVEPTLFRKTILKSKARLRFETIQLGQPIVEPYFILKSERYDGRQTWITPDSINGSKIHDSKYVGTVLGKIDYEIDYYNVLLDSVSIHLLNFDTLDYETIIHEAHSLKDK